MHQLLKRSHYQNYCIDHNKILQNDRDQRLLSVHFVQISHKQMQDGGRPAS